MAVGWWPPITDEVTNIFMSRTVLQSFLSWMRVIVFTGIYIIPSKICAIQNIFLKSRSLQNICATFMLGRSIQTAHRIRNSFGRRQVRTDGWIKMHFFLYVLKNQISFLSYIHSCGFTYSTFSRLQTYGILFTTASCTTTGSFQYILTIEAMVDIH